MCVLFVYVSARLWGTLFEVWVGIHREPRASHPFWVGLQSPFGAVGLCQAGAAEPHFPGLAADVLTGAQRHKSGNLGPPVVPFYPFLGLKQTTEKRVPVF